MFVEFEPMAERVEFVRAVDRYPQTIVHVVETGTIVNRAPESGETWIRLDRYVASLDDWDNCIALAFESLLERALR